MDENGIVKQLVEFSPERECIRTRRIDLIQVEDIKQLAKPNFEQVIEILGQPHGEIGGGFYIPAYLTEDAYLICFHVNDKNGVVSSVYKRDVLTAKIVERI